MPPNSLWLVWQKLDRSVGGPFLLWKCPSLRFETERKGPLAWGKGKEPLHPNRPLSFLEQPSNAHLATGDRRLSWMIVRCYTRAVNKSSGNGRNHHSQQSLTIIITRNVATMTTTATKIIKQIFVSLPLSLETRDLVTGPLVCLLPGVGGCGNHLGSCWRFNFVGIRGLGVYSRHECDTAPGLRVSGAKKFSLNFVPGPRGQLGLKCLLVSKLPSLSTWMRYGTFDKLIILCYCKKSGKIRE